MIYKVISTKKGFLKQSWCFVSCLDSHAGTWINFPPQLAAPMPLFLLRYAEFGPLNLSSLWVLRRIVLPYILLIGKIQPKVKTKQRKMEERIDENWKFYGRKNLPSSFAK